MTGDRAILKGGEEGQSGENRTMDPAPMAGGTPWGKSMRAALGGLGLALGVFALSVGPAMAADDCSDDSTSTGCSVAVGDSNEKKIEQDSDSDWFEVTGLKADTTYRFRQIGSKTDDSLTLLDPLARLRDADGNVIEENDDGGANSDARVTYTTGSTVPTLYWEADNHSDDPSGTYRVTVEKFIKECKGSTSTTCELKSGSSLSGLVDPADDSDWYQTPNKVQTDNSYAFGLINSGSLDNVYLELLDSSGNLHLAKEKANEARITFTATSSELFYAAASTNGSSTGEFSIGYQAQYTDDCPGNPPDPDGAGADYTNCKLPVPTDTSLSETNSGKIQVERDTDWFEASGMDGSTSYAFDLTDAGLPDPKLRIFDSNGNELAVDDDGGGSKDARLTFTPPTSGTYYVSAEASPKAGTEVGTYDLAVSPYDDDCFASKSGACGPVTLGNHPGGTIEEEGDVDWYEVNLDNNLDYFFKLKADGGTLSDPSLRIYDDSTVPVSVRSSRRHKDGSLSPAELGFRPGSGETGTYFVAVEFASGSGSTYTLETSTDYGDDHSDCDGCAAGTTTGTVKLDNSGTGTLEVPGDRDWFKFDPEADAEYTFSVTGDDWSSSNSLPALSHTYIRLIKADGSGTVIKSQSATNCGKDVTSELVHTANSSGDPFYVEAASCDDEYAGDYTVSASLNTSGGGSVSSSDGSSSSGGGCTLAASRGPVDPALPLLLGLSLAYLLSRGRVRAR